MTNQTFTEADFIIVQTTCANEDEATQIQASLLKQNLAACIQISAVQSSYLWQGNIENAHEYKLDIKSQAIHFDRIAEQIRAISSYDCPEVIALPILKIGDAYAKWLIDATTTDN